MNLRKGITQIFVVISVLAMILVSYYPAVCAIPADTMDSYDKVMEEIKRRENPHSQRQSQGSPVTVNINIEKVVLFSLGGIALFSITLLFRR
jgi:hypothetical protein